MKIRTLLLLLSSITLLSSVLIFSTLHHHNQQQKTGFEQIEKIAQLQVVINQLRSNIRLYEQYRDNRTLSGIQKLLLKIDESLTPLSTLSGEQKVYLQSLTKLNRSNSVLLQKLSELHHSPAQPRDMHLEELLNNAILAMAEDSFTLSHLTLAQVHSVEKQRTDLILALIISTCLLIVSVSLFTTRYFKKRLEQIKQAIANINQGNLGVRISSQIDDNELGSLATEFDRMSLRLKESTISVDQLQHEVRKRTYELEQQKNHLKQIAEHDGLTGLPNRNAFLESLKQVIARNERNNSEIAVFFIDLDKFKQINDSLGHNIGDQVLNEVTNRFLTTLRRKSDYLARIGGDEFTLIVDPLPTAHSASELAAMLLQSLEQPYICDGYTLYLKTSIGISIYPQDGNNALELMKNADAAMYRAKQQGGNQFQFYCQDMTANALNVIEIENDLRTALAEQQLDLFYQPQFSLSDNNLVGMEALVRWHHPSKGLIPPLDFIPLAEERGLIIELGNQVLSKACKQLAVWKETGFHPGVLAVNLSAKQIDHSDLSDQINQVLTINNLSPDELELEVTESYIIKDPEGAIQRLQQLRDMGINIALDDFGTGYSSLTYLKQLPITKLKIDKSFSQGVDSDPQDQAISKAIISMGRNLKLQVIAEGVETAEQLHFLRLHGCDQIQGYLSGKPVPADEFEALYLQNEALTE